MFPRKEHLDHLLCDLALFQEHPEYLMPEDGLQLLEFQGRCNTKHTLFTIETAIRQKDVAVGIESEEVAESLDGNDSAGNGFIFRNRLLHENFQGLPCTAAETGKKFPVVKKIPAEDFWEAKNEMPVGYLFEDIHAEPFPEFHHALLVAGRTKMTPFAGECQKIFVAAVFAFDAGKAVDQIAAIEITVDHLFDIRPPEAILP